MSGKPGARKPLLPIHVAKLDAAEWTPLGITSRDVVALERRVKGLTLKGFMEKMSMAEIYHAAFIAARREGIVDETVSLGQFEETYDIDVRGGATEDDDDESAEGDNEADPTDRDL